MSNISTDNFMGYAEFISGDDKGRYATVEVAVQAYADELESAISDTSKEACGVRIRNDRSNATFAELEAELDSWYESAEIAHQERAEDEARYVEDFKALVQRTIELGAGDEATALRWLTQDEEFYHGQDVESWVWNQGILFTDYGKEIVSKLLDIVQFKRDRAA